MPRHPHDSELIRTAGSPCSEGAQPGRSRAVSRRCSSSSINKQEGLRDMIADDLEHCSFGTLFVTIPLHPGSNHSRSSNSRRGRNKAPHRKRKIRRHTTPPPRNLRCIRSGRSIPPPRQGDAAFRVFAPVRPGRGRPGCPCSENVFDFDSPKAFSDDVDDTSVDRAERTALGRTHGAVTCAQVRTA